MGRPRGIKPGSTIMGSKWRIAYAAYFTLTSYGLSRKKAAPLVFVMFVDQEMAAKQLKCDSVNGHILLTLRRGLETENGNIRSSAPLNDGAGTFHDVKNFARQLKRLEQKVSESDVHWLGATSVAWLMAVLGTDHLVKQVGISLLNEAAMQGSGEAILPCWIQRVNLSPFRS